MVDLQDKLYNAGSVGDEVNFESSTVVVIFQAMERPARDGIKHVMSGVNPQGCEVFSFKQPSTEDLNHDFMWRSNKCMPERGRIADFQPVILRGSAGRSGAQGQCSSANASRDHSLYLRTSGTERFADINWRTKRYLSRNGVVIRKFFLNLLSKDEQKKRFLSRLEEPSKNWKFSEARHRGAGGDGTTT